MGAKTFLGIVALAMFALLGSGCARVTVVAPTPPESPVAVFLLDHGRHSSLVLPIGQGGMVRYSYGDWEFYALRRTGLSTALAALLGPTQAALGRKQLAGPLTEAAVRRQLRIGIEYVFEISVELAAALQLQAQLETLFEAGRAGLIYSAEMDVEFVPHPVPYTLGHNSNRVVGEWLEALGCTVEGRALWSRWRVVTK